MTICKFCGSPMTEVYSKYITRPGTRREDGQRVHVCRDRCLSCGSELVNDSQWVTPLFEIRQPMEDFLG